MPISDARRILVLGPGGAGKSTLARELGRRLDLPVIHLDAVFWQPGWTEPDPASFRARVEELVRGEAWVMDGNFTQTIGPRLERADTLFYLDFPRILALTGVLARIQRYHGKVRPDLPEGCPEQLDWSFLLYVWNYRRDHRPQHLRILEGAPERIRQFRFRQPEELQAFLDLLPEDFRG